jgi:hypothetical protein
MKRLILLSLTALMCSISFAQKINVPGYIVKNSGDSVHGFLQEEIRSEIVKQVKFSSQQNASGSMFTPADLKSFGYDNGDIYKSISFKSTNGDVPEQKNYFARELVTGEYNLFSYTEKETNFFVIISSDSTYFLYNSAYDALGKETTTGNFYQSIVHFGAYCEKMTSTSWVVYNEKSVTKFISELNQCVAPEKINTSHYHQAKIKYAPFAFVGGFPGKEYQITIEGGVALSSPQFSKKIFLKIGIHYSNTYTTEEDLGPGNEKYQLDTRHVFVSIPVVVQFNFTSGIIRPYANFGISFTKLTKTTYATSYNLLQKEDFYGPAGVLGIGVEGHISKSVFVNAEWRFEVMPQNGIGFPFQYPAIGIACRF